MKHRGFPAVIARLYNYGAAFFILGELLAVLLGANGGMASAGAAVMLVLISFPSSAILLWIFGAPIIFFPDSPLVNAIVVLGMFFVAGWVQWNLVLPFICQKVRDAKGGTNGAA